MISFYVLQGAAGEINSVQFFSARKEELDLENPENLGLFASDQCQLPECMDEENGPPCRPDSARSLSDADLTLSLSSSWVKGPISSLHAGFGSPFSLTSSEIPGPTFAAVQSMSVANGQEHSLYQSSTELGSRPTSAHIMPLAAQMTIFYAGIVNVYDDIPDDKAQAIMLLAGCGNPLGMSALHPPANEHPTSAPLILAVSPSVPASTSGDHCRDAIPLPASAAVVDPAAINQQCVKCPSTELPQARKASMQRFLEKRKERALAKAPYAGKNLETDDSLPPLDRAFGMFPSFSKSVEAGSASLVPFLQRYLSADNRPLKSNGSKIPSPSKISRPQEIVLNSKEDKGCKRAEVANQSEKLEMVKSVDAEIIESDEDSAFS
ncbi:hypothetical protein O6H91_Y433600 [Diphasiastrum complanatum]|nr:hypothetical protein O6H91_Y433600 [Diphasiastrum complanatum]